MDWAALLALLRRRSPSLVDGFVGASEDDLAALTARIGRPLPASYAAFLRSVGRASPRFAPLGASIAHQLSAIEPVLEAASEAARQAARGPSAAQPLRWLPVGIETDPSMVSPHDLYLDLAHANGTDAPLVEMESIDAEAPPASRERFGARVTQAVVTGYELPRCSVLDKLVLGPTHGAPWREVRAVLSEALGAPMLDAGAVAWWREDPEARCVLACSRDDAYGISLDIGGDDERSVAALVDHLCARLDGARRPARGPSPVAETALERKRRRRT